MESGVEEQVAEDPGKWIERARDHEQVEMLLKAAEDDFGPVEPEQASAVHIEDRGLDTGGVRVDLSFSFSRPFPSPEEEIGDPELEVFYYERDDGFVETHGYVSRSDLLLAEYSIDNMGEPEVQASRYQGEFLLTDTEL
jgi:hypothetical protein